MRRRLDLRRGRRAGCWRWRRDGYSGRDRPTSVRARRRAAWRKQPLRQEKSWKGEWKCNLKPFEAILRVRPPPGRGAARQPEASRAWAMATSLVKRRQRMLKPCVSLEIMYPLRPSAWVGRGRCWQDRQRRGLAGSAGVLEQGRGLGWTARKPVRSRSRPRVQHAGAGTPAEQCPGPAERPLRSAGAPRRTRIQEERVGPGTETIRNQVRAGGKS